MGDYLFIFLIVLLLLAAVLSADFVFIVIYLLLGAYVFGQLWINRALRGLKIRRIYNSNAFLGEEVDVQIRLENRSWLPIPWLQMEESLPVQIAKPGTFRQVVSLAPREKGTLSYILNGHRRGYYVVGPLKISTGDILGIIDHQIKQLAASHLIVYPKIIPIRQLKLPSGSPLGTLRHHQPIFEDPSRVIGKRDYITGDSLRRVDWKSSAVVGKLQVKTYEPSIALETAIFLNLNTPEYPIRQRISSPELGIIVAASIANWVISHRQSVGLYTNGIDPLAEPQGEHEMQVVPPRQGKGHLMRLLEYLARLEAGETISMVEMIRRQSVQLTWGTTLLLISGHMDEVLFDALFAAQRAGLQPAIILVGYPEYYQEHQRKAAVFGLPLTRIADESDLELWQR